mmetsp:Transcript_16326/g.37526  ORF Transcript_16326/g.37526 Transcript_16326/m.37526 type:complete len:142 (+) Transcript_16326:412-837(+)
MTTLNACEAWKPSQRMVSKGVTRVRWLPKKVVFETQESQQQNDSDDYDSDEAIRSAYINETYRSLEEAREIALNDETEALEIYSKEPGLELTDTSLGSSGRKKPTRRWRSLRKVGEAMKRQPSVGRRGFWRRISSLKKMST